MYIIDCPTIRDQPQSFTVLTSKAYLFSLFTQLLFANPEVRYSSDGLLVLLIACTRDCSHDVLLFIDLFRINSVAIKPLLKGL